MRDAELGQRRRRLQNWSRREQRRRRGSLRERDSEETRQQNRTKDRGLFLHGRILRGGHAVGEPFPFVIPGAVEEWSPRERRDIDKARRVSDWEIANQSLRNP